MFLLQELKGKTCFYCILPTLSISFFVWPPGDAGLFCHICTAGQQPGCNHCVHITVALQHPTFPHKHDAHDGVLHGHCEWL